MVILLMSRVPIIYINKNKIYVLNFYCLFTKQTYMNAFFHLVADNTINNALKDLKQYFLNPNNDIIARGGNRKVDALEFANRFYRSLYSDANFTGFVSPQANDFFQSNDQNLLSDFNNVSPIKCLFQIAMLGSAYNNSKNYTLENACMIIHRDSRNNFKWTGKYWKKIITDYDNANDVHNAVLDRIKKDPTLVDKIKREVDYDFTNKSFSNDSYLYNIDLDPDNVDVSNMLYDRIYFSKNLYKCIIGLEDYDKINFSLMISGMIGCQWDKLLSYFKFDEYTTIEKDFNLFKSNQPNFQFVQKYGTVLANYINEYKSSQDSRVLGAYNAVNFSRVVASKLLSVRDNIKYNSIYYPQKDETMLFPIIFGNLSLEVKTTCYRSFKNLLNYMKTRKQRDFMFDHLSHFGRRAMTVLDPYGIFMHFQDDQRGLASSD